MRLAVVVVAVSLLSCVASPRSGTPVSPRASSVTFEGLAPPAAGLSVRVEAQLQSGIWVLLGSAPVNASGRWTATVSAPTWAWWRAPCNGARFRFTGTDGSVLRGIDDTCLRAAGPTPTGQQFSACLVNVVDLFRGEVHVGDLAVTGQAGADAVACVTEVQGDLTVDAGAVTAPPGWQQGLSFTMPRLERVTGDVTIEGDRTESLSLPRLAEVGGDLDLRSYQFLAVEPPPGGGAPLSVHEGVNHFDLPVLVAVGGSVMLTSTKVPGGIGGSGSIHHDFGLPSLTAVGADVVLHNTGFPTAIDGLPALTSIPRDLVFDWGETDLDSTTLMPALTAIGRDASFVLPPNSRIALEALQTVGRDVHLAAAVSQARLGHRFLTTLRTVGGGLDGDAIGVSGSYCSAGVFQALEEVTGTLAFTGGRPEVPFGATGASHLTVGGLAFTDTALHVVPLHGDAVVAGAGPVTFTDNASLCDCQISAYASGLATRGWTGALSSSGNGAAATCAPCPGETCP